MAFRITGLSPEPFRHLYGLSEAALAEKGIVRRVVEPDTGFPDRIEMREGRPGEIFLLLNHLCQPADSPYRASHAIYVREGAEETYDEVDKVPEVMRKRLLSLRGFDAEGMIVEADVIQGTEVEGLIDRLFANPHVAYIHAHNAKQGCYSGRIDRA